MFLLLLPLPHIDLHRLEHELRQLRVHLVEVGLEARVIVVAIGESEQLIEVRRPEVVHVLAPAFNERLHFGGVRAFGDGRDQVRVDGVAFIQKKMVV